MSDLTLAMTLALKNQQFLDNVTKTTNATKKMADKFKHEFDSMKTTINSTSGKLASVGISIGFVKVLSDAAKLDKSLIQIRQTANATVAQQVALRSQLFSMSMKTGRSVDDLKTGFDGLVQSGLTWSESVATIDAINTAMAVTNAKASTLGNSLTVAGTAFKFDLSKPGQALELLDKMTVAGRLGNAELETLSDMFSRVAVNAGSAGMSFDKTLSFIEGLSMVERSPERLGTLVDDTLRLFTNSNYLKSAQKGTGVKFFNIDGSRRDAILVLKDIKKEYDKLSTDMQRANFISKAFGKDDQGTIKGMRTLLGGNLLNTMGGFTSKINEASGTLKKDLPTTLNNANDQAERLKNTLGEAANQFAMPINKALADVISYAIDKDKLGLSGGTLIGGGVAAMAALYAGKRFLPGALGKLSGGLFGTAKGVAEGKALEAAAGVNPVFVVNWPSGMGGNGGITGGKWEEFGPLGGAGKVGGRIGGGAGLLRFAMNPLTLLAAGTAAVGIGMYAHRNDPHAETENEKRARKVNDFMQSKDWQSALLSSPAISDRSNKVITPNVNNVINIDVDRNIIHSKSNFPVSNKVTNAGHLDFKND